MLLSIRLLTTCGMLMFGFVLSLRLISAAPALPDADAITTAQNSNQFALDLYAKLGADNADNLFFSPQSISTALGMVYAGAGSDTAAQIGQVLHTDLSAENFDNAQAKLMKQLNARGSEGKYELSVANRLWGTQGFTILKRFQDSLQDDYGAELQQLDFLTQAEQSRQTINQWVEEKTGGKIKELIPSGLINAMTKLVLTNAIYFKGKWETAFQPEYTKTAPFFLSADKSADVPLMYQNLSCRYGEINSAGQNIAQVLELPYQGKQLSLLVVLPKQKVGLPAVEKELSVDNLKQWTQKLKYSEVKIWLPKFKLSAEFQLQDVLAKLGMPLAFSDKADFSGIDGQHDLCLSAVVHKAYVDVNEEGTEAAAATGAVMRVMATPIRQPPPEFRADHPFMFLIRDNTSGCILFAGRVADPR